MARAADHDIGCLGVHHHRWVVFQVGHRSVGGRTLIGCSVRHGLKLHSPKVSRGPLSGLEINRRMTGIRVGSRMAAFRPLSTRSGQSANGPKAARGVPREQQTGLLLEKAYAFARVTARLAYTLRSHHFFISIGLAARSQTWRICETK